MSTYPRSSDIDRRAGIAFSQGIEPFVGDLNDEDTLNVTTEFKRLRNEQAEINHIARRIITGKLPADTLERIGEAFDRLAKEDEELGPQGPKV